ncbi:MAG: V-type ATP synthase subunit F [Eubacteriales bacterium]|nr:V-type ATP synthase subunit F [Eubacteriales bacterium]MDY3332844.1 V-type ATP synthase subunit F [Gallibacter sp.]
MYKVAVIGDRESVLGFKAIGITVYDTEDIEESKKYLHELVNDNYAIIYITEQLAYEMIDDIDRYKDEMLPAIIPIPNKDGATGRGMDNVKKAVERAVGADILFGGDK